MKTVILAGGLGSRLGELTETIPKPMITIGGETNNLAYNETFFDVWL